MDEVQTLNLAREAIRQRNKGKGRELLVELLRVNPRNETAWLWLSAVVDDPAKERECLKRVLKLNPNNDTALRHLAKLNQSEIPPLQPNQAPVAPRPQAEPSLPEARLEQPPPTYQVVPPTAEPQAVKKKTSSLWYIVVAVVALIALVTCSLAVWGFTRLPSQDRVSATAPREATPGTTPTPASANTPQPTKTPKPASKPTSVSAMVVRKDLDLRQDRGGILIHITRIQVARWEDVPEDVRQELSDLDYYKDTRYFGGMGIEVQNTTNRTIRVYPDQGMIIAGNEQNSVDLLTSDDVGGEIYAGVSKEGIVFFALRKADVRNLDRLRYVVSGPFDEKLTKLGEDYDFDVPLK